jgi:hypothetical protein
MQITKKCSICKQEVDIRLLRPMVFQKKLPKGSAVADGKELDVDYQFSSLACKNCLFAHHYG